MPDKKQRDNLDRYWRQIEQGFSLFKSKRESYDKLVHRDFDPVLDKRLGREVASYQTPALEKAEQDIADILTMNPTRFSHNPGEQGTKAQDAMRDATLLAARTWAIEDEGRWIDRAYAQRAARYGVDVKRMLYHEIEEPETEGYKDRDDAMKRQPWPFRFEDVPVLACGWLPVSGRPAIRIFGCEYDLPNITALEDYSVGGEKLDDKYGKDKKGKYHPYCLDDGKLGWVGDAEAADLSETQWDRKITVTIVEYQDFDNLCPICPDKHPLWAGLEMVRGADEKRSDACVVHEYVLPYKHAGSYRVIPGRSSTDPDPHFHYRPLNFLAFIEATVMNWAWSVLQTLANRDSANEHMYADMGELSPEAIKRIPDEMWSTLKIPVPDTSKGEIPLLPPLKEWPTKASEILQFVYEEAKKNFEAALPNRFLVGENFQESSQGTGTANLQGLQQARLPMAWPLSQFDQFILEAKRDQFHAIRYWDYEADTSTEMKFYANLTGEEGEGSEPGKSVYVSASKLEHDFDLLIVTENETIQEQAERHRQAYEQHDRGWIDDLQVLERLGFHDTKQQANRMAKYQLKREMLPVKRTAQKAALVTIMAAVADIDPALLGQYAGIPPQGAQGQPPPPGGPGGTVQLPPLGSAGDTGASPVPMTGGV